MSIPRAYQGNTVLSNGNVLTLGGSFRGGYGRKDAEVYSIGGDVWQTLSGIPLPDNSDFIGPDPEGVYRGDNHFWLFAQPDGWVFHAGPSADMHWIDTKGAGAVLSAGKRGTDPYSIGGNAVLFDVGRILKTGGANSYSDVNPGFRTAHVIDINNRSRVSVRQVAPMVYPRKLANSVVLPNGQVLVVGGQRRGGAVLGP
jgi:galactose oxidase